MAVALRRRRREHGDPDDALDMPDNHFRRDFRLSKGTVRLLYEELAVELEAERATGLSVERKVWCALRFFATRSFEASVRSEETTRVSPSTVSECVRRVAEAAVNAGARNKWVHFPKTAEENTAVKEGLLRRGVIPGVIGCVDCSLVAIVAPKGERKAAFMCRKGCYVLNCMFVNLRLGHEDLGLGPTATGVIPRRFRLVDDMAAPAVSSGAHRDSGYPLEPWLLTPVPGHPPVQTAEGQYNTAHATMRSVVERCIGFLKTRFCGLQRNRTLLYDPERAANIVAACAVLHNLRLSEGDIESGGDSDDDSSNGSSSRLDGNGDPIPHGGP
ncbi:putative nuclease HARBI1 [Dermacentor albipictus]|uniref:putative nuclease HARBI1 n=1 Tax=Dermacentor albipictus TaxID=60249 RepID=UPI0038FCBAE8